MASQPGATAGAGVGLLLIYLASVCTCVGWVVGLPVLMFGMETVALRLIEGRATPNDCFAGTQDLGRVVVTGWGLFLCLTVIMLPALAVVVPLHVSAGQGMAQPGIALLVSTLVSLLWGLAIAPVMMAPWLWVDRSLGPVDAVKVAFESFRPHWVPMCQHWGRRSS